ncbi:GNAT family N-acetyltransferase [Jeotgalibacillus campisalis]|uniref:Aminoglycoside N6'-acetyltransferase n=1 Tax=Jeotgalibacillus campisalis TaxID=220754 RepID=A0A0C2QZ32_9BACL|nr:GNAT family protein [Jeotgalibacillus campisalis]KIL43310.1 aminoglycoside N6'-acetyltransferase [Jeotgalibacillus campisalis]
MNGKTVYLRPIKKEDLTSILMATCNEEIRYLTGTTTHFTIDMLEAFYNNTVQDQTRHDFSICLKDKDVLIGDLSILEIDEENKKAGFRIALHQTEFFNKGYGTEALSLALKFAFDKLNLNRLQLEVFSHNLRAIKSYEKAGFKIEGRLRQSIFLNNEYSDEIVMGMLREEYETGT